MLRLINRLYRFFVERHRDIKTTAGHVACGDRGPRRYLHHRKRKWWRRAWAISGVVSEINRESSKALTRTRVRCSECGASVSNEVQVEGELYVRAFVQCVDCIEREANNET